MTGLLGAIFAGGAARRFGSDKAAMDIEGRAMIDRVADRLRAQCDRLVVVGREWPGLVPVQDRPAPGLGPLGGLAGALAYAAANGFAEVLTSGCDLPDIPDDLAAIIGRGPAVVRGQPLLGRWPATLAEPLVAYLESGGDRAMRSWIAAAGARMVALPYPIANINTRDELRRYLDARPADRRSSP